MTICRELQLPIWLDPSNRDTVYARNRIRLEVLPALEELHPGCSRRIAELAERVSHLWDTQQELTKLALARLLSNNGNLNRRELNQLSPTSRQQLLESWLHQQSVNGMSSALLQDIVKQSGPQAAPGSIDLKRDLKVLWSKEWIILEKRTNISPGAMMQKKNRLE